MHPDAMHPFARAIVLWQRRHGRSALPWQGERDPYRIWVSEVMLQQTQVDAVAAYYRRFLERFPSLAQLARARAESVLRLWSGLGYYARARHLHAAARTIVQRHGGRFPRAPQALAELPGIGRSTAGAIAAFAFGARAAILDGNVKRVLARCFGVRGYPGELAVQRELWALTDRLVPARSVRAYTQGLMDLGATVCRRAKPACESCPVRSQCVAHRERLIDEVPAPRPRKTLPLRRAQWLVALHDGRVLLERRPPTGLWGGLWGFPRAPARDAQAIGRAIGAEVTAVEPLAPLEHAFTHFRLRVQPLLCRAERIAQRRGAPQRWMRLADAADAAVPVPVRRLLQRLAAAN